jgi:hypothetical protein
MIPFLVGFQVLKRLWMSNATLLPNRFLGS